MRVDIRPAKKEDLSGLNMNEQGLRSCRAYLNASVFAWTGLVDGQIVCIWGLVPPTLLSDSAYLWLITTPVVEDHKFAFVRHSQIILNGMLDSFPLIVGHVLADQPQSKKWLKWLGVKFMPAEGRLIPFELRRASCG